MKSHTLSKVILVILSIHLTISVGTDLYSSSEAFAEIKKEASIKFPTKPISIIIPYPAGGGTDVVGRMFAKVFEQFLSQPVVVINKVGGGGVIGTQEVASSNPDGYTLLSQSGTMISQTYLTEGKVNYKDWILLGIMNKDEFTVVVAKDAPWVTFDEFIKDAKNNPGKISMAVAGVGTSHNLSVYLLEKAAGVRFNKVPYAGGHPMNVALLGKHVDSACPMVSDAATLVKSGEFRMLAVSSGKRVGAFPEVPTYKEKGMGIDLVLWRALWARKEVPKPVLEILGEAIDKALGSQVYKDMLKKAGYTPIHMVNKAELQEHLQNEDRLIKDGLKLSGLLKE